MPSDLELHYFKIRLVCAILVVLIAVAVAILDRKQTGHNDSATPLLLIGLAIFIVVMK